jgi:hypothetical protein
VRRGDAERGEEARHLLDVVDLAPAGRHEDEPDGQSPEQRCEPVKLPQRLQRTFPQRLDASHRPLPRSRPSVRGSGEEVTSLPADDAPRGAARVLPHAGLPPPRRWPPSTPSPGDTRSRARAGAPGRSALRTRRRRAASRRRRRRALRPRPDDHHDGGGWRLSDPLPVRASGGRGAADGHRRRRSPRVTSSSHRRRRGSCVPDVATPGSFRFHVSLTRAPARFLAGTHPSPDGAPDTYEASTDTLDDSSFAGVRGLPRRDDRERQRRASLVSVAPARPAPDGRPTSRRG